jgi:hypothetical protein
MNGTHLVVIGYDILKAVTDSMVKVMVVVTLLIFGNQRTRGANSGKFRVIEGITTPKNAVIGL